MRRAGNWARRFMFSESTVVFLDPANGAAIETGEVTWINVTTLSVQLLQLGPSNVGEVLVTACERDDQGNDTLCADATRAFTVKAVPPKVTVAEYVWLPHC